MQQPGGLLLPPVQKLVATLLFAIGEKAIESLILSRINSGVRTSEVHAKATQKGGLCYWQRMRDSNPRKRSQSPVCYRYTNPLNGLLPKRMIIITISRKKSRLIFSFLQKLKPGGTGL